MTQTRFIHQYFYINTNVYLYAGISSYYNYLSNIIKPFFSDAASLKKKYTKKTNDCIIVQNRKGGFHTATWKNSI